MSVKHFPYIDNYKEGDSAKPFEVMSDKCNVVIRTGGKYAMK
jgi:hypothetical protein